MTDLHCHILPNIDDGAKDVSISLRLLEKEYADGVRNIAFTSHFNSEWTTPDAFLQKRAAAYETLTAALPTGPEAMQFRFKLGCEVYFSPKLCELDAKALCIGDTSYMLVEFPTTHKPHFIRQTFALLQEQGVLPLIAHIERYPYVLEDPTLLYNWVAAGAYVQINAGALLDSPKLRRTLCKFISWQLVHVISTDTHSLDKRPPRMADWDHDPGSDGCCPKTEKGVDMSGRKITTDLYSSSSDQRSDGSGWILSCCDLAQPHDGRVCCGVFCSSCHMLKRTQDHEALSLCPGCARKNVSSYWSEPFLKVPYFFNSLSASANFLE